MSRIFVPTSGAPDWNKRLIAPDVQWEPKHSAYELAVTWEAAQKEANLKKRGLPAQVAALMDTQPDTEGASLIFAAPEHQVVLDGRGKSSQTDMWALLKSPGGLVSLAVEGKFSDSKW